MSVSAEDAKGLLSQVRRWLQLLLHEDPMLMSKLSRLTKKKAVVSLTLLNLDENAPEPKEEQATKEETKDETAKEVDGAAAETTVAVSESCR